MHSNYFSVTNHFTRQLSVLLVAFFCCITILSGQTPLAEAARKADIQPAWPDCDPKLPDCTKSRMADFIAANLQIPLEAKEASAGGVVVMEFVIEKTGLIGEVHPMHDPGHGLGAEATRVINLMKTKKIKWIPAVEDGKKIAFRFITPVSFNIPMPAPVKSKPTEAVYNPDHVYELVDVMPRFEGCDKPGEDSTDCTFTKMVNHIKTNLKYPEEAVKNNIQGQVVVEFVVDTTGEVSKAVILKGLGHGCDEESLRVVRLMHNWIPGTLDGKPVPVKMKLPILFQLPKPKE